MKYSAIEFFIIVIKPLDLSYQNCEEWSDLVYSTWNMMNKKMKLRIELNLKSRMND
jgi:hypothetical protein